MVKTKRGEKERKELDEENRRLEEQIAALEAGDTYIPSPKRKKKKEQNKKDNNNENPDSKNLLTKAEDFDKWWGFYMGCNKLKQFLDDDELKHVKKMNLFIQEAEFETVRELREGNPRISVWFEMDSTPFSARVQAMFQQWTIERGSSILNFSVGVMIPTSPSSPSGTSTYAKIPLITPSYLMGKNRKGGEGEAERLYAAAIPLLTDLIESCAPDMEDGGGDPLVVAISMDWAASNRLAFCYILAHLDSQMTHKNFCLTLQRCIVHSFNNNAAHGCLRIIKGRTKKTVREVSRVIWKRAALMNHNSQKAEQYVVRMRREDFVVRSASMIGLSEGCRVAASQRFSKLLNQAEELKTLKAFDKANVHKLSFFEDKVVWVKDGVLPKTESAEVLPDESAVNDGEIDWKEKLLGGGVKQESDGGLRLGDGNGDETESDKTESEEDRLPTESELKEIKTAMRRIGISVTTGSSNRWTMQARSCRTLLRASVSKQIEGIFDDDKSEYHVGHGEFVNLNETFGEREHQMTDLLSLAMSFVSRPADRAILSMLKVRDNVVEEVEQRLQYMRSYQTEYERCMEQLSTLKEGFVLLMEIRSGRSEQKRLEDADQWVFHVMMALLACRAQIECTSGEECLERLGMVERDLKLTSSLCPAARRPILIESVQNNLTSCVPISSKPECLACAMMQDIAFVPASNDDEEVVENVISFIKTAAASSKTESSLVERVHGWFVKVAKYLKIGDVSGCGARTQAQATARNFQKIEKSEMKVEKAQEKLTSVKEEKCPADGKTLIQCGLQMFKSIKHASNELTQEAKKKFCSQKDVMAEWLIAPEETKINMGQQYKKIREAEFKFNHDAKLKAAQSQLDAAINDRETRTLKNFWRRAKVKTGKKWTDCTDGVKKCRDLWNKKCTWEVPAQTGEMIHMWREEPGMLVAVTARIAYAMGNGEKRQEHLDMVSGLNHKLVPQSGWLILNTNCNGNALIPRSPALNHNYLVIYASTQPLSIGMFRLKEKRRLTLKKKFTIDFYDDPVILSGHGWLGAKFVLYSSSAHVNASEDIYEFSKEKEVFKLADALAEQERKKKPQWEKEKKQYKPKVGSFFEFRNESCNIFELEK